MTTRQASDFERGLLVGSMIASMMPNTLMIFIFLMVICYDLGRPRIIEVVQKMIGRMTGMDLESPPNQTTQTTQTNQTSYTNQPTQPAQNAQPTQNTQSYTSPTQQSSQGSSNLSQSQSHMNLSQLGQQSLVPGAIGFGLNLLNQQLNQT